jgi:hypothetical protein
MAAKESSLGYDRLPLWVRLGFSSKMIYALPLPRALQRIERLAKYIA